MKPVFESTEILYLRKKHLMSINGKKKFKRILNFLLGGRRKVQVMKFFSSLQHLAAVQSPNIAELVPSLFFFPFQNHGFCGRPNTIPGKHPHKT